MTSVFARSRSLLAHAVMLLLGLTLVLGAAAFALWAGRVEVAGYALRRFLVDQGLGPVDFRLDVVEPGLVVARDVRLRGGAFRLSNLELRFSIGDILDSRVEALAVRGLHLDLEPGPDGLLVGGAPLVEPGGEDKGGEDEGGPVLGGLAIESLALDDVTVVVHRTEGDVTARLSTAAHVGGDRIDSAGLAAHLTGAIGGAPREIDLTASGLSLDLAGGGLRLGLQGARIAEAGMPWRIDGAVLDLDLGGDVTTVTLSEAMLRNLQAPARLVPLEVAGKVTMKGDALTVSARARAPDLAGVSLAVDGDYDLAAAKGRAHVAVGPVDFAPEGLQPVAISPALDVPLKAVTGRVSLAGDLQMEGAKITSALDLVLADVGFQADVVTVADLDTAIRITRPWPLATAAGQSLSATVGSGGEQARITFKGRVPDPSRLKVQRIGIEAAGGTITAENFDVDLGQPAMQARFAVDGVDLGEVTRVLGIQGLDGTGVLDGTVPLSVAGEEVAITDAQLSARGPGVLRYRPDNLPPQIAQAGDEVDLVLRALTDFHYDSFGLTFGKAVGGEGFVRLAMAGANPAVMDSQPFNFNIRIESNFARLADLVLLGLRSAQDLLGRAAGSVRP